MFTITILDRNSSKFFGESFETSDKNKEIVKEFLSKVNEYFDKYSYTVSSDDLTDEELEELNSL